MSSSVSDLDRALRHSLSLSSVIELKDNNESYRLWKSKMENKLYGKQLWSSIEPTSDQLEEFAEEEKKDEKAAKRARVKSATEARCLIFSTLSNSLIPLFENKTDFPLNDAKALWLGIVRHFESSTLTSQNNLRRQLNDARMKEDEKIDSYVSRIMQAVRSLQGMNLTVTEHEQLYFILNGLPPSYDNIKLILLSATTLTVAQATLRLREYQEMQTNKAKNSSDPFAEDKSGDSTVYYQVVQRGRGAGNNSSSQQFNNKFRDTKRNGGVRACYSCGSTTHIAFNCPKNANAVKCTNCRYIGGHKTEECRSQPRGQNNYNGQRKFNNESSTKQHNNQNSSIKNNYHSASGSANLNYASSSDSEFDAECYYKENVNVLAQHNYIKNSAAAAAAAYLSTTDSAPNDVKLVLDSGSSVHTCNDRSLLSNIQPAETQRVRDANGNVAEYNEAGTMHVTTEIGGEKKSIEINNMYYAPNCPVNLLSVGCLSRNGKRVTFYHDDAFITEREDERITMGFKRVNNIYITIAQRSAESSSEMKEQESSVLHVAQIDASDSSSSSSSSQRVTPKLWHHRFGHVSYSGLSKLLKSASIVGLDRVDVESVTGICHGCAIGKSHRKEFHRSNTHDKASSILDRVHSDINGPFDARSADGSRYLLTIIDEKSRKGFGFPLKHKSEAANHIINWCRRVQNETGKKVVEFHSDNGTEFVNRTMKEYFEKEGVLFTTTTVATPQHNSIAERYNRTIVESAKSMLAHGNIPKMLWREAVLTAIYIRNYCLTRVNGDMPPNAVWKKEVHILRNIDDSVCLDEKHFQCSVKHLRTFGCNVYVHIPDAGRKKLDEKSCKGILLGYSEHKVGYYYILLLNTRKMIRSRDVLFDEDNFSFVHEYGRMSGVSDVERASEPTPAVSSSSSSSSSASLPQPNDVQHELTEEESAASSDSDDDSQRRHNNSSSSSSSSSSNSSIRQPRVHFTFDRRPVTHSAVSVPSSSSASSDSARLASASSHHSSSDNYRNMFGISDSTNASIGAARFDNVRTDNIINHSRRSQNPSSASVLSLAQADSSPSDVVTPKNYKQAMLSPNRAGWLAAIDKEKQSIISNDVFELVERPAGVKVIKPKWVLTMKGNPDATTSGQEKIFKARVVGRGFDQVFGENYFDTFAPVMKYKSFRLLLALAAYLDYDLKHLDVPTAFLNADVQEDVYMEQPEGFSNGDSNMVWKLKKSLYGIKQAPMNWNHDLDETLRSRALGFTRCKADTCIYVKLSRSGRLILLGIFVDDLLPVYSPHDVTECNEMQQELYRRYKIKEVSSAALILGMRVTRDRANRLIKIEQAEYIDKTLKEYGMDECKPNVTPMSSYKLSAKDCPVADDGSDAATEEVNSADRATTPDRVLYQRMIGSLNYAAISTRPDITFAVNVLSRYLQQPGAQHMTAAKTVMRYLRGTTDAGLIYDGNNHSTDSSLLLDCYSDSDWAGDVDDRHSTSGYVIRLNGCTVSWRSKRQKTVALSSCEAEYYAISTTMQEIIWMQQLISEILLHDQQLSTVRLVTFLHVDNQSAIQLSRHDVHHDRSKHIDIRHHFIRDAISRGVCDLRYIPTEEQLADLLTKSLGKFIFRRLRAAVMSGDEQQQQQ